ncbi:murein DD-endopeptidase MepM/ murein hydrolase activator NlpD [Stackebrandtia albiflava]|uniref:Murein DD-endopeptidase MepM/ murein hydrolase activator NlpD n=1 Tax=Stackebrandtia albiflava TaxID=406432 RepID=A0A562V1J1_9ACTN|nr:M23 family metallopeptidase [Stackebrandtia albiflava]TWJ11721.1 murein DD-endopeptidase MepM/ murein hydrolase activator NlpD [Stackebrandtia albiflava]
MLSLRNGDRGVTARPPGRHRAAPLIHRGRHRAPISVPFAPQGRYVAVVGMAVLSAGAVALGSAAALPSEPPDAALATAFQSREEPRVATPATTGAAAPVTTARSDRGADRLTGPLTVQPAETTWRLPLDHFDLTSLFGMRWGVLHQGLDFGAPEGAPVYAAQAGTVASAGWNGGFGKLVVIDHGDGVRTYYAHNSRLAVAPGDVVEAGDHIADVGNTGNSFGPHSHFELHVDGAPVDPVTYLGSVGVDVTGAARNVLPERDTR